MDTSVSFLVKHEDYGWLIAKHVEDKGVIGCGISNDMPIAVAFDNNNGAKVVEWTGLPDGADPKPIGKVRGTETLEVHRDELKDAADKLLSNLWGSVVDGRNTHEENWRLFERKYPGVKWLHHALKVTKTVVSFQGRVSDACRALFDGDPTDVPERRDRFFEESNETCQALGMTREEAHQLVDYTYDRPVGDPNEEVGSALVTLAAVCCYAHIDLMGSAEADLAKLQRPETIARIRAKRATRHGRGPLPGLDPAALASEVKP